MFERWCRLCELVASHGVHPAQFRHTFEHVWERLTDDEKERAPAIPFPTVCGEAE